MSSTTKAGDTLPAPPPYGGPGGTIKTGASGVTVYHLHSPVSPPPPRDGEYENKIADYNQSSESPNKFVSYDDTQLGRNPGMTTCIYCRQQVLTNVQYKVGTYAWLMCLLFILCGLIVGCCLIPFFVKFFKDAYHTCPKCQRMLHIHKRSCCD